MSAIEGSITGYWILQITCGQPTLRGPFESDAARVNEFDMCLIDPGNDFIVFIDPGTVPKPTTPYAWRASFDYTQERLDYINNLPDE